MSEAQLVALRIGSMEFDAWHCPRCYPNSPSSMTVLGFERRLLATAQDLLSAAAVKSAL